MSANAPSEEKKISIAPSPGRDSWPKVLIVDDDAEQVKLASWLIKAVWPAAVVQSAVDGDQAVSMASALRPHLVLTDIRIPGPSGVEVCRLIKQDPALSGIKVVTMTGYDEPETRHEALAFGADAYLTKPFDHAVVRQKLARVLGKPPSETWSEKDWTQ